LTAKKHQQNRNQHIEPMALKHSIGSGLASPAPASTLAPFSWLSQLLWAYMTPLEVANNCTEHVYFLLIKKACLLQVLNFTPIHIGYYNRTKPKLNQIWAKTKFEIASSKGRDSSTV